MFFYLFIYLFLFLLSIHFHKIWEGGQRARGNGEKPPPLVIYRGSYCLYVPERVSICVSPLPLPERMYDQSPYAASMQIHCRNAG